MNDRELPRLRVPVPEGLTVEVIEIEGTEYAIVRLPKPVPQAPELPRALREVLDDVLQGLSTRQIAERRGRSPRTVSNQIGIILRAYGVCSRAELFAACTVRQANDA